MSKSEKLAALYIATLKAMAIIHQHNHWTTKGPGFYGDHLLFERLYDSALENLDLAAEKFLGVFGEAALDYDTQNEFMSRVLEKYKNLDGSPVDMSLAIETDFLKLSTGAYNAFESEGTMTLGLDDMIMSIANKREESVYLLKQSKE